MIRSIPQQRKRKRGDRTVGRMFEGERERERETCAAFKVNGVSGACVRLSGGPAPVTLEPVIDGYARVLTLNEIQTHDAVGIDSTFTRLAGGPASGTLSNVCNTATPQRCVLYSFREGTFLTASDPAFLLVSSGAYSCVLSGK